MIEVNIRIFFQKEGTELFPDYHRHIDMMKEQLSGKIKVYLDETEAIPIYQYYSISLLGCIETHYLRRMQIGKSVMVILEGLEEYVENRHFPKIFKEIMYCYLRNYLNSLDYIIVSNKSVEQKLRSEGVRKPQFYEIPKEEERNKAKSADLWMTFYEKIAVA